MVWFIFDIKSLKKCVECFRCSPTDCAIENLNPEMNKDLKNTTMKFDRLPEAQGLYDPANEHENCGIGFVAHIRGQAS